MYNHAPENYVCPFCRLAKGEVVGQGKSGPQDIFYHDEWVTGLISLHHWPNNRGNAILIPNLHYENIYDLPDEVGGVLFALSKRVALAMKSAYGCTGISTRQHNEPDGNQDVWHFHLHVFPRYPGDHLYEMKPELAPAEERAEFAEKLRREKI